MRCTQYIGLTSEAQEFVKNMEVFSQTENNDGMFSENVPYLLFLDNQGIVWIEVLQVCPWSSGPMIFTCLENEFGSRNFQWQEGTPEDSEYSRETGRYYI